MTWKRKINIWNERINGFRLLHSTILFRLSMQFIFHSSSIFRIYVCVSMNFSVTKVYRHSIISIHVWWRQAHTSITYIHEVDRWWCIKINKRTRRMDGEVERREKKVSLKARTKKNEKVPSIMLLKRFCLPIFSTFSSSDCWKDFFYCLLHSSDSFPRNRILMSWCSFFGHLIV